MFKPNSAFQSKKVNPQKGASNPLETTVSDILGRLSFSSVSGFVTVESLFELVIQKWTIFNRKFNGSTQSDMYGGLRSGIFIYAVESAEHQMR